MEEVAHVEFAAENETISTSSEPLSFLLLAKFTQIAETYVRKIHSLIWFKHMQRSRSRLE